MGVDTRTDGLAHHGTAVLPDSGGFVAFLSPEALVSPATDWVLRAAVRVPAVRLLNGRHHEGTFIAITVIRDL
jgi:hypothetical protein